MAKINLMGKYPKSNRASISKERVEVSEEKRAEARKFDWLYFWHGERSKSLKFNLV